MRPEGRVCAFELLGVSGRRLFVFQTVHQIGNDEKVDESAEAGSRCHASVCPHSCGQFALVPPEPQCVPTL